MKEQRSIKPQGLVLSFSPQLACEIGFNETLLLVALDWWISESGVEREGSCWVRKSVRDIQREVFPFMSTATISRVLNSLSQQGLIKFAQLSGSASDEGRWITLEEENIRQLNAFREGVGNEYVR